MTRVHESFEMDSGLSIALFKGVCFERGGLVDCLQMFKTLAGTMEETSFSRYVRLRLDNVVRGCVAFVS